MRRQECGSNAMVTVQMTVEEYLEMKSRQDAKEVTSKQKNLVYGLVWLQHDHSVENQEQRMDPSGNQSGRSDNNSKNPIRKASGNINFFSPSMNFT